MASRTQLRLGQITGSLANREGGINNEAAASGALVPSALADFQEISTLIGTERADGSSEASGWVTTAPGAGASGEPSLLSSLSSSSSSSSGSSDTSLHRALRGRPE